MHRFLVFTGILAFVTVVQCNNEGPDFNYGLQIVGKVFKQFLNSQAEDLKIADGVHIINTASPNDAVGRSRGDNGVMGSVEGYLQNHEIRIRLPELMPTGQDFGRAFKDAVAAGMAAGADTSSVGTGRGKSKGGGGGGALMMLGGMFGSMLGALGIGGVGLLAMKALTVSAMALMLAAVVALKKLAGGGGDDGGHHVIHASGGHGDYHRRKREASEMAYSAWTPDISS